MDSVIPAPLKRSALRKARQRIAAGAVPFGSKPFTSTLTRVLPIADAIDDAVWAVARDAALTFRGVGPGSLFDLLIHVHADGWRLFSSGADREAFLLQSQFDASAFDTAIQLIVGAVLPGFSAAALRATLAASPRGVGSDTDAAVLAARLARGLGASKAHIADPPALARSLADALTEAFPTWRGLAAVGSHTGEVIDRVLADTGHRLPSLANGWSVSLAAPPRQLGVPTLAFDPHSPVITEADPSARFAAVVARYLPEAGVVGQAGVAKAVQSLITTPNGNAMSWLFSMGRRALRDRPVTVLTEALQISGVRAERALADLIVRVQALPPLTPLGERAYPDARASLQGSIDSLISNYLNRLAELDASATRLASAPLDAPALLTDPATLAAVLQGMPFTAEDIVTLYADQSARYASVLAALSVLCGRIAPGDDGFAPVLAAIESFGQWTDRFQAVIGQVNQRLKQLDRSDLRMVGPLTGENRWKSLVSLTPPEAPPIELIPQLDAELKSIVAASRDAFNHLTAVYHPTFAGALEMARQDVRQAMDLFARRRKQETASVDIDALARRKLLDQVARLTRRGSAGLARAFLIEAEAQGLTRSGAASERSLRGFVLSGEQRIYAHPLSRVRSIVRLEKQGLASLDVGRMLAALYRDAGDRQDVREQLLIRFAEQTMLLSGLPERIALKDIRWTTPSATGVAPAIDLRDRNGTVARSEVIKAFVSTFHSRATGLLYRLGRPRFSERYDIRCFVGPTVMFVPRDGEWKPPAQYRVGKFEFLLSNPGIPWKTAGKTLDTVPTARWLVKHAQAAATGTPEYQAILSLLAQLPHDWVITCDFAGAPVFEGVYPSAGTISGWFTRKGYRLDPPRHFAGTLLAAFKDVSLSPHGLTFERLFERQGDAVVEIERRAYASIPVGGELPAGDPWVPRHLIGLDLGEAGLGVCVKQIETGQETTAFLRTKRVRRLARSQEHYRKKIQPRQAFRKPHSLSMELAVKAAIGELCGLIDNLMVRYDGVPVFESGIASARGSNKMVQRVYAGVLQRYAYVSNNQSAQALRQSHWFGASRFEYAYGTDVVPAARELTTRAVTKAKVETVFRPASGGPGVVVSGYRTSLQCSCCGRDPVLMIEDAIAGGQVAFQTNAEGIGNLELPGGAVGLRLEAPSPNPSTQRAARRRKRRAPFEVLANRTYTLTRKIDQAELIATVRRALRRPAPSVGTIGTSQWEFHCPLLGCQRVLLADVNAATNLVRRYVQRVRTADEMRSRWDDAEVRAQFATVIASRSKTKDDDADDA